MSKNYIENLVGCIGFPIEENPSCVINNAAFADLGINWHYLTLEVKPDNLEESLSALKAFNMRGCNFTIPHKINVLNFLDELSEEASIIGACNVLSNRAGKLIGNNTDGKGFVKSLTNDAGLDLKGKKMLFLGAGGAARAMSVESALSGASHILIASRTKAKGAELVDLINNRTDAEAELILWDSDISIPAEIDILANATNVGMYPNIDDYPSVDYSTISSSMLVTDAVINPPETKFLKLAKEAGAKTLDGMGMLVYQAAIAIEIWTGKSPDCEIMKKALLEEFKLS
ncbi:MAG: shikimate dehydrogenase [Lentisphaeraceae bacterium]|nr:shikimate dehydrogenase [Lentisphaeraceae bacterium]